MGETLNPFPNGAALETASQWSSSLKVFQQRLGKYFTRSEARQAACDYIQAKLVSSRTQKWERRCRSK